MSLSAAACSRTMLRSGVHLWEYPTPFGHFRLYCGRFLLYCGCFPLYCGRFPLYFGSFSASLRLLNVGVRRCSGNFPHAKVSRAESGRTALDMSISALRCGTLSEYHRTLTFSGRSCAESSRGKRHCSAPLSSTEAALRSTSATLHSTAADLRSTAAALCNTAAALCNTAAALRTAATAQCSATVHL